MPEQKPQAEPASSQSAAIPAEPPAQKVATLGDFVRVLESLPKADQQDH